MVTNPGGQRVALTNAFTYTAAAPPPTLSALSPASGPTAGGTVLTLFGADFQPGVTVLIGGTAATAVTVTSPTQLTVTTPPGPAGAATVVAAVVVLNPDGQRATLSGAFTYTAATLLPPPTLSAVSPASGPSPGGTVLTLSGSNFQAGATVTIGAAAATTMTVISATQLTATTPSGNAGPATVAVTNPDGQRAALASAFTYLPALPLLSVVLPTSGPSSGGTRVTLIGANFLVGATVTFGGTAATSVNVLSTTQITAITPSGNIGPVTVVVTNPDGQSSALANAFAYLAPPTLSAVRPQSGSSVGGDRVTLDGANFLAGATVTIGGTAATAVNVLSTAQISAMTPPGPTGTAIVVVTNPDGQQATLANAFTYIPAPTLSTVSPSSGPSTGGTRLTLTGSNFLTGASVSIGSVAATTVTVVSATQITAVAPPFGPGGSRTVTVTNPDGQSASLVNAFTYIAPLALSSVTPSSGPIAGGTPVTLNGTGFQTGATVMIGGLAATAVALISSNQITATTPPGPAGPSTIVVTNPDGQSASRSGLFTYLAPPTLSGVTPSSGPAAGGTRLTLSGTNFQSSATVTIAGVAATNVLFLAPTQIMATTPPGSAGPATIVVTNPDGERASLANAFTYIPAPTLSTVSPTNGPTGGGTLLTLTGTNFLAGASVTVGNVSATNVTVISATQLTALTPSGNAGPATVAVTNPDGQRASLGSAFTYLAPRPTLSAVSPTSGPAAGGTRITLTGTNFLSGATVTVGGGAALAVTFVSSTQLMATTPPGSGGPATVMVTNPDGQSASRASAFNYLAAPPTLSAVSPSSGPTTGGTRITLTGTNLLAGATVTVGGTPATAVTVVSATQLTATTPASNAGPATIVVTNPDGRSAALATPFTYTSPNPTPTLSAVAPASGPTAGGTLITLTGSDFLSGATVTIGGSAATAVTVVSATQITATTPSGRGGLAPIVVTNPDGQSASLSNAFSYLAPPSAGSLYPGQAFALRSSPSAVAVADFNGDGQPDIVTANSTFNEVSVLLNRGDGTFLATQTFVAGGDPRLVAVGDFNSDGRPDLVTANRSTNNVSVLLGNGDGTFQAPVNFTVGGNPQFVVAADVNGDGRLDLVTANNSTNDVSVLLGNGNGTFQAQRRFATSQQPVAVAVADLNGDGKLDLVTVNGRIGNVSVLLGNGDGTFQAPQTSTVRSGSTTAVAIADLNGDGKRDLVTIDGFFSGSNTLSVSLGNGDGTFQAPQTFTVGSNPVAVAIADLNGDGKRDLVTVNSNSNDVSVLLGNGDGTFQAAQAFGTGTSPVGLAVTDANGDGQLDIVIANGSDNTVSALLGKGDGTFQTPLNVTVAAGTGDLVVADFNGDARLDLATIGNNVVSALQGNGDGTFQAPLTFGTGPSPQAVAAVDVNGDGRRDLLVANTGTNDVSVLLGNGDGTFQPQRRFPVGLAPVDLAVADFNRDSKPDIVVINDRLSSNNASVLLGNGDGTFQAPRTVSINSFAGVVTVADVNGDGRPDFVTASFFSNVAVTFGNGDGTFQASRLFTVGDDPEAITVADINGDGRLDLITVSSRTISTSPVAVALGNGDGTFQAPRTVAVGVFSVAVTVADINGDGKPDLLIADNNNGLVALFLGNGDGTFQPQQNFAVGGNPASLVVADVNNDGLPDIVVTSTGQISVLLHR